MLKNIITFFSLIVFGICFAQDDVQLQNNVICLFTFNDQFTHNQVLESSELIFSDLNSDMEYTKNSFTSIVNLGYVENRLTTILESQIASDFSKNKDLLFSSNFLNDYFYNLCSNTMVIRENDSVKGAYVNLRRNTSNHVDFTNSNTINSNIVSFNAEYTACPKVKIPLKKNEFKKQ